MTNGTKASTMWNDEAKKGTTIVPIHNCYWIAIVWRLRGSIWGCFIVNRMHRIRLYSKTTRNLHTFPFSSTISLVPLFPFFPWYVRYHLPSRSTLVKRPSLTTLLKSIFCKLLGFLKLWNCSSIKGRRLDFSRFPCGFHSCVIHFTRKIIANIAWFTNKDAHDARQRYCFISIQKDNFIRVLSIDPLDTLLLSRTTSRICFG